MRRTSLRRAAAAVALPVAALLSLSACATAADLPAEEETTPGSQPTSEGTEGAEPGDGELTAITVAVLPIGDLAAYFVAESNGIFQDHGLDVTTETAAGGSAAIAAMTAGDFDIVYSGADGAIKAYANDLPIRIISGANYNQPEGEADATGLVVTPGISDLSELQGAAIGTNALGNINQVYAQEFLAQNGVTDVEVVEIPFPEQVAALVSGQIKATLLPEPFASAAVAEGATIMGYPYRIGEDQTTAVGVYVTTEEFLEQEPETVEAFVAAMAEASEMANDPANREQVIEAVLGNTRLAEDVARNLTFVHFTTDVTPEQLQATADLLTKYEVLPGEIDVTGILAQ